MESNGVSEEREVMRERVLADIKAHPENHRHDFSDLHACCVIGGVLDSGLLDAHATHAPIGWNGGRACDVTSGPCACGAWH